jgi:glycosyltransferase involved in cell wall biosynthesis
MKICIDIQSAVAQRAGVGRYTDQLVRGLNQYTDNEELSLFCFDFKNQGTPFDTENITQKKIRYIPGRVAQLAWKTIKWPPFNYFSGKYDIYHFPNFFLPPLSHGKSVVTIHDMSFMRYPEFAEEKNLRFLTRHVQNTVDKADAIITDSQFSADEICELMKIDSSRIFPIHLGINDGFSAPSTSTKKEKLARLKLNRPYLLTVGTVEPRKNIPFLIKLFEQMGNYDGELVIAGMAGWKCDDIITLMKTSSAASRIRYLNYVEDNDLAALYSGADCFITTSFYEGFGFPPLEAMACGTPVLSSSGGSLAEVLSSGASVIKGFNIEEWKSTLTKLLTDSAYNAQLKQKGPAHAAKFTWKHTAEKTMEVYRTI